MELSKNVRIAVLGAGHLGSIHTRLWKTADNAELIGIYEPNPEQAKKVSEENGVKIFATLEEAFANVDAVTIASPTSFHYELAVEAINAGKHCFIEKPITATYQEAEKLITLARKNNVLVQVGHVERFNPGLAALHGYHIAPLFIEAHRLAQFKPRATDVSVVLDLMIHDIDIALSLVQSSVVSIDAHGVAVLTETPDIANARIRFANGCVANLTASRISAQPMRKMRLFQKNAYLSVDFAKGSVDVYRLLNEGEETSSLPAMMLGSIDAGETKRSIVYEQPIAPQVNAIAEEQRAFINAILGHSPIAVSAVDAAEALRIAEEVAAAIERSTQQSNSIQ
jgi:predicted dehydrogenase